MEYIDPIQYQSKEDIFKNIEEIVEIYTKKSVVVIRDANLTFDEQVEFAKSFGEYLGWYPNKGSNSLHNYQENHKDISLAEVSERGVVLVPWHLEHVDYDSYSPIYAGIWNMFNFAGDTLDGNTYFTDTAKIYKDYPDRWKDLLDNSTVKYQSKRGDVLMTNQRPVDKHPVTGETLIRLELNNEKIELESAYGSEPEDYQNSLFSEILEDFNEQVENNSEIRMIHMWREGDLLVTDLFKNAHAVTGGFDPEKREFYGIWVYRENPETEEFLEHLSKIYGEK